MGQIETNQKGRELLLGAQRKQRGSAASGGKSGKPAARRDSAPRPDFRERAGTAAGGLILGVLAWHAAFSVGAQIVPIFRNNHTVLAGTAVAALLAFIWPRPAKRVGWSLAALVMAALLVIGYTRYPTLGVKGLVREDPLERVEAVVVLSSDIRKNGDLDGASRARLLHGFEVLGKGYARELILTRLPHPRPSYVPAVRKLMDNLGLNHRIRETGTVQNTHDEAVEVRKLAQKMGWKKIILVSDPTHMRRAQATFRKQGLEVICSPCVQPDFHPYLLMGAGERYRAFTVWLWEEVGYLVYRRNGWL